jgi:hypothetical protein
MFLYYSKYARRLYLLKFGFYLDARQLKLFELYYNRHRYIKCKIAPATIDCGPEEVIDEVGGYVRVM